VRFKSSGDKSLPAIIILHGGGLSWWSLQNEIDVLQQNYYVVTPVIDGHGEDGDETFASIEDSAKKLIKYIDESHNGKVYAIGGLSIGAQIVTETLSLRQDIAQYAIIESALVFPIKGTALFTVPAFKLFYGLMQKKWFSKMQAKTLFVPENMFERYYEDSLKISKTSLINITLSNGNYKLKSEIHNTRSKVMIVVGGKELGIMKKSAKALHEAIPDSELRILPKMGHGEISLVHPAEFLKLLSDFFANENIKQTPLN
jgi:pimeloyl-ACP methyl ester carboxylesterase